MFSPFLGSPRDSTIDFKFILYDQIFSFNLESTLKLCICLMHAQCKFHLNSIQLALMSPLWSLLIGNIYKACNYSDLLFSIDKIPLVDIHFSSSPRVSVIFLKCCYSAYWIQPMLMVQLSITSWKYFFKVKFNSFGARCLG